MLFAFSKNVVLLGRHRRADDVRRRRKGVRVERRDVKDLLKVEILKEALVVEAREPKENRLSFAEVLVASCESEN